MAGRAQHVIQKRVSLGRGRVGHAGTVVPRVYACFTTIVISPPPLGGPSRICLCSITSQCTISSAGLVGILIDLRWNVEETELFVQGLNDRHS